LHKSYWRKLSDAIGNVRLAKCQTIALITFPKVIDRLSDEARKILTDWFKKYDPVIRKLGDEQKQRYNDIRGAGRDPMAAPFELPNTIESTVNADATTWIKHIYVNDAGEYATGFNDWEKEGIREEIARLDVIGWFRNPSRKTYSLRIPYENEEGGKSGVYPDFIVFRQTEHGIVADIVDPHLTKLTDAAPKAKGFAVFVRDNPEAFSRVIIMRKKNGVMQSLDIKDEKVLEQMLTVKDNAHLGTIYDTLSHKQPA
jgi:type III restriction enzyme